MSVASASYYALFAVAFSLVLKVTKIWNFAQAGLMTTAFYLLYWGVSVQGLPVYLAVILSLAVTILLGVVVEKYAFMTLRRRKSGGFTFFIFTLIFSEFIAYLFTLIFGTEPFTVHPNIFSPVRPVAGIIVSDWDIRAVIIGLLVLMGLYCLLRWTRPGRYLVAVSNNHRLAELYGISAAQAYLFAMGTACVLITLGVYVLGTKIAVHPHFSLGIILMAVAATVMGGINNIWGTAGAALVLSLLQGFSVLIIPSRWQNLLLYIFFFVIIVFMPSGFVPFLQRLRGRRE